MKKSLLILCILSVFSQLAIAQDFPYGEVDNEALAMKKYAKDTSAHAVVLDEFGTSRINFDNDYNVRITFEYHTKIKFFDDKEFDQQGTFEIPIYTGDNSIYEDLQEVKGVTFYKDENGLVREVELDPKKIYKVVDTKHWSKQKFAMPGLRSGCVIEVSYKIVSPYLFNFRSWDFQDYIPKINSEYEVHIPGFWNYNASLRGFLKLTKNEAKIEKNCFTYGDVATGRGSSADCSDIVYGMKDVPAFIAEDYMTSKKNFMSSVNFELTDETDINSGAKRKYTKEWKDIDLLLKSNQGFGSQLKRIDLMKDRLKPLISNKTNQLENARAIYDFIKKTIKWNKTNDYTSDNGIKQGLDSHVGNAADINLALITALNAGGIPTEAVLLSTREHGSLNKLYPNLSEFDYVIAKANIGNESYFLDATDQLLPFGMLPLRCLNDQGRVMSLDKPSYWIDLNLAQKEKSTSTLDFTLQADGKLKGTIVNYSIGYEAYKKRTEIKKFNSVDEYVEDLNSKLPKLKILKSEIINLDSLDQPIGEKYEVEIDLYDKLNGDKLMFNPFFMNKTTENPFKLVDRSYPVDWGMPSDDRFVLIMHLPEGYTIETPPQKVAIMMPDNGGKFLTSYETDNNSFTFSNAILFNKGVYTSQEYPYLKELYNKIIQSEKSEMIFKKK